MSRSRASAPSPPPAPYAEPVASPAHSGLRHVRATVVFLVLAILVSGFAYPLVVTGIAEVVNPSGAAGSLLRDPNGTIIGSSLIAQNTSQPYLFWSRPSFTDYNMFNGTYTDPGPSDPALGQLINETLNYTRGEWNFTVNASIPFWYVAPSASSLDPDVVPEAVLIQIPRVSEHTNLSVARLLTLVNAHITNPPLPYLGEAYVNVLELDIALLPLIGR